VDTKYFKQAVDEYVKKNKLDSMMPMSAHLLSQLLERAQQLKLKAIEDAPPTAG
jgi:hypothetical protein